MTRKQKERDIEKKVRELMRDSKKDMSANIKKAINCGGLDINSHEGDYIIPRIIFLALLKEETYQYKFHGGNEKFENAVENVYRLI